MDKQKIDEAIDELKKAEKACADSYAYGNIKRARELLESLSSESCEGRTVGGGGIYSSGYSQESAGR